MQHFDHPLLQNNRLSTAHGVNQWKSLNWYLSQNLDIAEGDVSFGKHLAAEQEMAIMAHPPTQESDLSLQQFISENAKKGGSIKLDIKDTRAIGSIIQQLRVSKFPQRRIIFNADVISGNSEVDPVVEVTDLKVLRDAFPDAVCSMGFVQGAYHSEEDLKFLVQEINRTAGVLGGPLSLAVRADIALIEVEALQALNRLYHLTLWNDPEVDQGIVDQEKLRMAFPRSLLDIRNKENIPILSGNS